MNKKPKYKILHLSDLHLIETGLDFLIKEESYSEQLKRDIEQIINGDKRGLTNIVKRIVLDGTAESETYNFQDSEVVLSNFADNRCFGNDYKSAISFLKSFLDSEGGFKTKYNDIKTEYFILTELHYKSRLKDMISSFAEFANTKYDVTVVTGDIYDFGKIDVSKDENVKTLLSKIVEMSEGIFVAFGNHDMCYHLKKGVICASVNESLNGGFFDIVGKTYREYKEVIAGVISPESIPDKSEMYSIIKKYENALFIDKNVGFENASINENFLNFEKTTLYTTGVSIVNEHIAVVVLNSAWLNVDSKECHGQLVVGQPIVSAILDQLKAKKYVGDDGKSIDGKYIITMLHNDFNWHSIKDHHFNNISNNKDRSSIQTIIDFSDIILCGHEHKETEPTLLGLEAYLLKVGGTFRNRDLFSDNTFSVYSLDFGFNTLSREVYEFKENGNKDGWLWQQKENIFITELKPKDAKGKFYLPHRSENECFQIMKKNKLLREDGGFGMANSVDAYVSILHGQK